MVGCAAAGPLVMAAATSAMTDEPILEIMWLLPQGWPQCLVRLQACASKFYPSAARQPRCRFDATRVGRHPLRRWPPQPGRDPAQAAALLPFSRALQAIVNGSRDRRLADAPDLRDMMAAEIGLLIDALDDSLAQAGR